MGIVPGDPLKNISPQPIDNEMELFNIGCLGFSVTGVTITPGYASRFSSAEPADSNRFAKTRGFYEKESQEHFFPMVTRMVFDFSGHPL